MPWRHTVKLIVDLDGVVFNFTESLKHYLVDGLGVDPARLKDTTTWDFYKDDWGYELEEYLELCHEGVDAGYVFRLGPTWEGAVEGLHRLKERGHDIIYATDRSLGTRSPQNTIDWLNDHAIGNGFMTGIMFTADKTLIHGDILIEDRDKNYLAVEAAGNALPVMMTRPWNLHVEDARRVNNWEEFVELVDYKSRLLEPV